MSISRPQGLTQMRRLCRGGAAPRDRAGRLARPGDGQCRLTVTTSRDRPEPAERMWRELSARRRPSPGWRWRDEWNARTPAQLALIAADAGRWDEAAALVAEAERLCPVDGPGRKRAPQHLPAHAPRPPAPACPTAATRRRSRSRGRSTTSLRDMQRYRLSDASWCPTSFWARSLSSRASWCWHVAGATAPSRRSPSGPTPACSGAGRGQLKDALDRRVMAEPITPAEQRVLELLPTHLTVERRPRRAPLSRAGHRQGAPARDLPQARGEHPGRGRRAGAGARPPQALTSPGVGDVRRHARPGAASSPAVWYRGSSCLEE